MGTAGGRYLTWPQDSWQYSQAARQGPWSLSLRASFSPSPTPEGSCKNIHTQWVAGIPPSSPGGCLWGLESPPPACPQPACPEQAEPQGGCPRSMGSLGAALCKPQGCEDARIQAEQPPSSGQCTQASAVTAQNKCFKKSL